MFPNLKNTNISSESNYYDFNKEREMTNEINLFDSTKFYLSKETNEKAYKINSYDVDHYVISPINKPYPFFPTNPYYNIFGDWNNKWIKK
jgi:hypothetical protein